MLVFMGIFKNNGIVLVYNFDSRYDRDSNICFGKFGFVRLFDGFELKR